MITSTSFFSCVSILVTSKSITSYTEMLVPSPMAWVVYLDLKSCIPFSISEKSCFHLRWTLKNRRMLACKYVIGWRKISSCCCKYVAETYIIHFNIKPILFVSIIELQSQRRFTSRIYFNRWVYEHSNSGSKSARDKMTKIIFKSWWKQSIFT